MRQAILTVIALVLVVRSAAATTVTNLDDSGAGSLRAAVAATAPGGVVDFAPGLTGTITLTSPIAVNGLTITGPGASTLRISGGHASRLFDMIGATTVEGVALVDASIPMGFGAVVYGDGSGPHVLRDCLVEGNEGDNLGAVLARASLTVERCTFNDNVGATSGGALFVGARNGASVTLAVRDSVFMRNGNGQFGAAITLGGVTGGTLTATIVRTAFADNHGAGSSALHVFTLDTGVTNATLANATVVGRAGDGSTAVIGMASNGGTNSLDIVNSTIVVAGQANGGLLASGAGTMTVTNSIVYAGIPPCTAVDGGVIADGGHNLASSVACGFDVSDDPKLDPLGLADHGGLTPTIALLDDSPARDAGDDAACAASPVDGIDQRGIARPIGAHCDIGAFEAPALATTTTTTTTLPPAGCPEEVTAAATGCRIDTLRTALGAELPSGALLIKLDRLVGQARDKLDASEGSRAAGKTKPARASLAKARAAFGRFRKAIKSKAAVKALTADQRSELAAMASRILRDLRFLKG